MDATTRSMLPRLSEFPQSRGTWWSDLVAGVTVGVVALPLALGFGVATGVGAAPGLITAIVAGIVAAVFGGSNLQVSGPTGAMTVVLIPVIATHGVAAVPVVAVMAGILVLLAGALRLGRAITFIPWPVVEGFTVGIATVIFLQQVPVLLGVGRGDHANTLLATIDTLGRANWETSWVAVALAGGVAFTMVASRRIRPRAPASLLAVALATIVVWAFQLDVPTIGTLDLGSLFQPPAAPGFNSLRALLPSAAVVAMLAALESLLSARVADGMSDVGRMDPDRELAGQGLANIASGMFGGMPATGAIARTAVNVRAGARTRMSAVFHALVLIVVLFGAARLLAQVPLAAVAAVLMVTAAHMVDIHTVRALIRAGSSSAVVFVSTAAMTLVFDLARAVEFGIVVAVILVLRHSARSSGVTEEPLDGHLDPADARQLLRRHVMVYRLEGALIFGAAQRFLDELSGLDHTRVIVLRLGALHLLDISGAQVIAEAVTTFEARGIEVLVCGIQPDQERMLAAVGIPGNRVEEAHVFGDLASALEQANLLACRPTT